jgi:hypothetical protein
MLFIGRPPLWFIEAASLPTSSAIILVEPLRRLRLRRSSLYATISRMDGAKGAMEVGKGGERRARRSPPLPTIHPGTKGIWVFAARCAVVSTHTLNVRQRRNIRKIVDLGLNISYVIAYD